jgi:hypothetical protein
MLDDSWDEIKMQSAKEKIVSAPIFAPASSSRHFVLAENGLDTCL